MGVKGLYTLLSNEPSRFGQRLLISQSTPDVDIYIDAPALHHHLIHCYQRRINLPPLLNFRDLDKSTSTIGIVSPCTIFQLSKAFIRHLLDTCSSNSRVHCVFDGVASQLKEKQQLERIKENCSVFDQASRSFVNANANGINKRGNNYHIPHLFGEDAMLEAIELEAAQSKSQSQSTRIHIHFAEAEAESFIADMVSKSRGETESAVILSNDSDFLVFPSVASFVPLHSLEYTTSEDGKSVLMGWEYKREKFVAAYPEFQGKDRNDAFCVMTTMAALAGCDYNLSPTLQRRISSGRNVIVNSNIGGLRQRDRNDPSARGALLAVLRYISHFRRTNTIKDWLFNMADSIASAEGTKDVAQRRCDFLEALSDIRNVYAGVGDKGNQIVLDNIKCEDNMVDLKRLLLQRKFYCKPIMELCEGARHQVSKARKTKGKKRKNDRLSVQTCIEGRIGSGGSLWMESIFVECRDRVYEFIANKHGCNEGDENDIIEHCRSGGSNQLSYKGYQVAVESDNSQSSEDSTFRDTILQMIGGAESGNEGTLLGTHLEGTCQEHHFIAFASLLLKDATDALMLITLALAPKESIHRQKEFHTIMQWKEYMVSNGRIQIALYHTGLIIDAAIALGGVDGEVAAAERYFSPRNVLCDERLLAAWSIVSEVREHEINDEILGTIKGRWNRSFHTQCHDWSDDIDTIWNCWLEHQSHASS